MNPIIAITNYSYQVPQPIVANGAFDTFATMVANPTFATRGMFVTPGPKIDLSLDFGRNRPSGPAEKRIDERLAPQDESGTAHGGGGMAGSTRDEVSSGGRAGSPEERGQSISASLQGGGQCCPISEGPGRTVAPVEAPGSRPLNRSNPAT